MHSRRALLYMPGDDRRKIEKSISLSVDSICMDMEDGVAITRKIDARAIIAQAMKELDFGKSECCIRINSIGSGLESYDLVAALATNPDTIVVPKIESADQVRWVSDHIESYELSSGRQLGSVSLLVGVETAKGIVNLRKIAEAIEVLYARQAVVTASAANDLQAIDMVYIDFRDQMGLRLEAEQGAGWGFSGKQVIHPNQVPVVQEAFTPSAEEIDYAKRVVETFDASQREGKGAYALDGKMIDIPVVDRARRLIARHEAIERRLKKA